MSVVVFRSYPDRIEYAADTQISDGDLKLQSKKVKLFKLGSDIFGSVSSSKCCFELKDRLTKSKKDTIKKILDLSKSYPDQEFLFSSEDAEGTFYIKNGESRDITNLDFFAIGTGAKYALGALEKGATPEEAVKIACKYDLYCSAPYGVQVESEPTIKVL